MKSFPARLDALEKSKHLSRGIFGMTDGELWRAALPNVNPSTVDREATSEHWLQHRAALAIEYVDTQGQVRRATA